MYHLRLKGDHYQMGVKRGTIFQKGNISFPLHLDAFQLEHGKQSEQILKKYFPEVCEEIRGVSDTIGADYLSFASWMLCMGCCMLKLEVVRRLPIQKAAGLSTDETTICHHFCGMGVKAKSIPLLTEIGLISQHPPLSTARKV